MSSRGPNWDYYQCKCGNVVYEYNTVTGEKFMSETWSQCISSCMLPAEHVPENASPNPPIPIGPPKKNATTETEEETGASCSCSSNSVDNQAADSCTAKPVTQLTPPELQPPDDILVKTSSDNASAPTDSNPTTFNAEHDTDKTNGAHEHHSENSGEIRPNSTGTNAESMQQDSMSKILPESNGHRSPQESNGDVQITSVEPISKETAPEGEPSSPSSIDDKPTSKDEAILESEPPLKDDAISDVPAMIDESIPKDEPNSKEEPMSEDEPILAKETDYRVDKAEERKELSIEHETPPNVFTCLEPSEVKHTQIERDDENVKTGPEKMIEEDKVTKPPGEIVESPISPSEGEDEVSTVMPSQEEETKEARVSKRKSPRNERKTKTEATTEGAKSNPESNRVLRKRKTDSGTPSKTPTKKPKADPESKRVLRKKPSDSISPTTRQRYPRRSPRLNVSKKRKTR